MFVIVTSRTSYFRIFDSRFLFHVNRPVAPGRSYLIHQNANPMCSKLTATSIVLQAINNVKPNLEVRKVRKSGRTILVPRIVPTTRQEVLAMRWIIESARQKRRKSKLSFSECLALEFFYAFQKKGQARQKRDELHKIAHANRAFLRFRWW